MKATGIVRRIDELGRVVIPIELRRTLGVEEKDPMEIFVQDDMVIFKKFQPGCTFCGNVEHVKTHQGKAICQTCITALQTV
jgi:transcriptional pleiotropic regulator of transition state genes